MVDRCHRRPLRCRVGCDRGRSDHRHVGRIDGRGPDNRRDPDRTARRHPFRCAPATEWSGRVRPWTRSIGPSADQMERTSGIIAAAEDPADMRRRMGAAALEMDAASDGSAQTRWRATVAARLPSRHWPERRVLITAVDAHTGEPVVFDRHSGVDLADAIAASCASGSAHGIGDNRYIDGGYRRKRECRSGSRIRAGPGAVTTRRQNTNAVGVGHASCSAGRRTTRPRQQSRNDLAG